MTTEERMREIIREAKAHGWDARKFEEQWALLSLSNEGMKRQLEEAYGEILKYRQRTL